MAQASEDELFRGLPDPAQCIFRHVTRTSRAVVALYDAALADVGLTGHQFNLLMTLYRMGAQSVGDLAKLVGMDGSSVPRAVAPMQRNGWVTIKAARDRRRRIMDISAKGRRLLMTALPVWAKVQSALLEQIGLSPWDKFALSLKELRTFVGRSRG